MSSESKKIAFGLTAEEAIELKKSVSEWTDENSPVVPQSKGGNFRNALKKGSEQLRDSQFINYFK